MVTSTYIWLEDHKVTFGAAIDHQFDAGFYRTRYVDLAAFDDRQAREHFITYGFDEGRIPCAGAARETFIESIPSDRMTLEIGPFANPALAGDHVRYADILSTEELRARAVVHDLDPTKCPEIHYVLSKAPLDAIEERFASVFSSHCIEHQPDLVAHLRAVSKILEGEGAYYVICPDKRYCFDHFLEDTTIADVLRAHSQRRTRHSAKSWIAYRTLVTHNDSARHWRGDHGSTLNTNRRLSALMASLAEYTIATATRTYLDCHAWQFTPASFQKVIAHLSDKRLIDLELTEVYDTMKDRYEFCAVLRKRRA